MIQTTALSTASGYARTVGICQVAGGFVYSGTYPGTLSTGQTTSPTMTTSLAVQLCAGRGYVWAVDGQMDAPMTLTVSTNTVSAFTSTSNGYVATVLADARLCTYWRDRLVLASTPSNPSAIQMSKLGAPFNWDFSLTGMDRPWDGTTALAGRSADIVTALIPWRDDILIVGGDHSISRFDGDPCAGGALRTVSEQTGIMGPRAWTQDEAGTIYFVGTDGFYAMPPNGLPTSLSAGRASSYFRALDRDANWILVEWDRERRGCYIFITPKTEGVGYHLWYQSPITMHGKTVEGFYPFDLPADIGPVCSTVFDGDGTNDRAVLLGGRGSYTYKFNRLSTSDDGRLITSKMVLGPLLPVGQQREIRLDRLDITLGELPTSFASFTSSHWACQYTLAGAGDAKKVLSSPTETRTGDFTTAGRQAPIETQLSYGAIAVTLENDQLNKFFSLENVTLGVRGGGRKR